MTGILPLWCTNPGVHLRPVGHLEQGTWPHPSTCSLMTCVQIHRETFWVYKHLLNDSMVTLKPRGPNSIRVDLLLVFRVIEKQNALTAHYRQTHSSDSACVCEWVNMRDWHARNESWLPTTQQRNINVMCIAQEKFTFSTTALQNTKSSTVVVEPVFVPAAFLWSDKQRLASPFPSRLTTLTTHSGTHSGRTLPVH